MTLSRDAEATIGARLADIDRLISLQLNEVMHHPSFQKLEATWRGIKHLLDQSETNDMLKIKLLNVTRRTFEGSAACSGIRSERLLQEGI